MRKPTSLTPEEQLERKRAWQRRWYARNREKCLAYQTAYRARHLEKVRAASAKSARTYYHAHREEILVKMRQRYHAVVKPARQQERARKFKQQVREQVTALRGTPRE